MRIRVKWKQWPDAHLPVTLGRDLPTGPIPEPEELEGIAVNTYHDAMANRGVFVILMADGSFKEVHISRCTQVAWRVPFTEMPDDDSIPRNPRPAI